MPGWAPFTGIAVILTLAVLLLARRSSALLRESTWSDGHGPGETTGDGASGADARAGAEEALVGEGTDAGEPTPVEDARPSQTPVARTSPADLSWQALLANVVATQGMLVVLVLVAVLYFDIPQPAVGLGDGPWVWGLDALGLGIGLGLGLWLASEAAGRFADAAGVAYDERLRELLAPETPLGWAALFLVALPIVALAEELLFRAALIGVPAAGFGLSPWILVAASATAFALAHGAQGRVGMVATGLFGLALGSAFVLFESLAVVAVAHYVVNVLEFGVHEFVGVD